MTHPLILAILAATPLIECSEQESSQQQYSPSPLCLSLQPAAKQCRILARENQFGRLMDFRT